MSCIVRFTLALALSTFLISCGTSYEAKGDRAYGEARKALGNEKRIKEKMAYIMYMAAVKAKRFRVNTRLRDRFIEMCLVRANLVLGEGSAELGALPLFVGDLDSLWAPDVPAPLRKKYADFLVAWADSSLVRERITEALERIDKAIDIAPDKAPYAQKRGQMVSDVVKTVYELAWMGHEEGKLNNDTTAFVRAEYYVKVALALDSTHEESVKLLSKLREDNIGTYSAYLSVIEDMPDTVLFDKVNKWDILLAAPSQRPRGRLLRMEVSMYNYSYNPQRLRARNFYLVDVAGNKYEAKPSSKVEPEILDQEHETALKLVFAKPSARIKKLVYENGEHYSEKVFF